MKISALTVCVNYADLLAKSLDVWVPELDRLVVVSTLNDEDTRQLCLRYPSIELFQTDAFYRNGAVFNKALAIVEAVESLEWLQPDRWQLFFDADIIPPGFWRMMFEDANPQPGFLYGAKRIHESGEPINDRSEIPGYFQLFHSSDPRVQAKPILDTSWKHAGGADSYFHQRWDMAHKVWLPMQLVHQGDTSANWCGRGNTAAMKHLLEERKRVRGIGRQERFVL
jgi:hypothetical protein